MKFSAKINKTFQQIYRYSACSRLLLNILYQFIYFFSVVMLTISSNVYD